MKMRLSKEKVVKAIHQAKDFVPPYPSENKAELELNLPKYILDFNDVRPHGPLNGLTPTEAFRGDHLPENFRTTILKKARLDRLAFNRENQCGICKK